MALLLSRSDPRLVELGYVKPDIAIFADTGWEPEYVYSHLDWLEEQLTYPLIRVSDGDLKTNLKRGLTVSGHSFVDVPLFMIGKDGKKGMLRRQCTYHYKIRPIYRRVRVLAGGKRGRPFPRGTHAEMWLGISLDEMNRMKPSREKWVQHRWPLVDIGMTRGDCIEWFESEYPGRHLPRSACVICPFRSDEHWIELKRAEPSSYDEAVAFDSWLRSSTQTPVRKLLKGRPYLHVSRRPLDSVLAEREAEGLNGSDPFNNECDGICGV
ncbi:MAG: hypothetical protein F4X19_07565 [Acidobacteria bacterium]|nr:hypothetical protein [Acidobacteriota bacterium]